MNNAQVGTAAGRPFLCPCLPTGGLRCPAADVTSVTTVGLLLSARCWARSPTAPCTGTASSQPLPAGDAGATRLRLPRVAEKLGSGAWSSPHPEGAAQQTSCEGGTPPLNFTRVPKCSFFNKVSIASTGAISGSNSVSTHPKRLCEVSAAQGPWQHWAPLGHGCAVLHLP